MATIVELTNAARANPDTAIIFGHINAFNSPDSVGSLLDLLPNLYADFFAGFTARNPGSTNTLADFVPVIEGHPDRFMVSTDSGFDVGLGPAIIAIYELLDLLTPETACRVAYQNFEQLIETELPTRGQIQQIAELSRTAGLTGTERLNKRQAHERIFELGRAPPAASPATDGIQVEPVAEYTADGDCAKRVRQMRAAP